jgi:DNA ligase (NAD+)
MKEQIQIPTNCPSCNSILEQVNSQLFCRDKDCPAQSTKKVEAFAKKMRIKGLGPSTISKLGFVKPIEIYKTSLDTYVEVLGEKIGTKVFNEIENSKTTTFATFLAALSIPLIGDTASKKIAQQVNDLGNLNYNLEDLDIGEKASDNIHNWFMEEGLNPFKLQKFFKFKEPAQKVEHKGNVCITGKLNDFSNRRLAKEFLEEQGYTVTSTVSGKTNYLVCEDGSNSSKVKKAESLDNVSIVTIAELIKE